MRNISTIALKELKSYLTSPMAYIVIGIFLIITGFFFGMSQSTYAETSIGSFLEAGQFLLLLLAAILTMRSIAEEKKLGTIELLLTSPVKDSEVIVGKFLGSVGILLIMLLLTLYYPILLMLFGDPDLGPIGTGYLGLFLYGCTAMAVGIFASSVTANQIVSAVLSGGLLFGMYFLGATADFLPKALGHVTAYLSIAYYFPDFTRGIIDTRGIIFYVSITVLFLFLAIRSLENSRWN
jgi:ABC-2 type transport system permease protein